MSIQAMVWVLKHSKAKGTTRCVLMAIADEVNAADGDGWTYVETVLDKANCSENSYRRAIDWLIANKELKVAVRQGGTQRHREAYRPNLYRMPGYRATLDPEQLARAERGRTSTLKFSDDDIDQLAAFGDDDTTNQTPSGWEGQTSAGWEGQSRADWEGPTPPNL